MSIKVTLNLPYFDDAKQRRQTLPAGTYHATQNTAGYAGDQEPGLWALMDANDQTNQHFIHPAIMDEWLKKREVTKV